MARKKNPTQAQMVARANFVKRYARNASKRKKTKRNSEKVVVNRTVQAQQTFDRPTDVEMGYKEFLYTTASKNSAGLQAEYNSLTPAQRAWWAANRKHKIKDLISSMDKEEKAKIADMNIHSKRKVIDAMIADAAKQPYVIDAKANNRKSMKGKIRVPRSAYGEQGSAEMKLGKKGAKADYDNWEKAQKRKKAAAKARRAKAKKAAAKKKKVKSNPFMKGNSMAKKRKSKGKHKKHKKAKRGVEVISISNAKRKGKKAKHKRKKSRRNPNKKRKPAQFYAVGEATISKKGKRLMKRSRKLVLARKKNPDYVAVAKKYAPVLVAGMLYPAYNYGLNKLVGKLNVFSKGAIANVTSKLDAAVPGVSAPLVGGGIALAMVMTDEKYGWIKKAAGDNAKPVTDFLQTVVMLATAEIGRVIANKAAIAAGVKGYGYGMGDVIYFPMSGADFGREDGYHQQPGDFGNVRYFPGQMAGVEYFPQGSRGDAMYASSAKDQAREAMSLGIIPEGLGELPEGLGSADFGLIPEGLSGQEDSGQMG